MAVKLVDKRNRKYKVHFWHHRKHYAKIVRGTKRFAEEVEAKLRAQLAEGTVFPQRRHRDLTLLDGIKTFLKEFAADKPKPQYEYYLYSLRRAEEFFGAKRLVDVTPEDVRRFRAHLKSEGLQVVSVNHSQKTLRRLYSWLAGTGRYHGQNPASGRRVPLENERPFWRKVSLDAIGLQRIIEEADPQIRPIVVCAAHSGARKGELARIKVRDVNLDNATISIPQSKNGEPGWIVITDTMFSYLDPLMRASKERPDDLILNFTNFEKLWREAKTRAGFPKLHFHDLRHVCASFLSMGCRDQYAVQLLLRLKTPGLVARYAHLFQSHLRMAALTLDRQLPIASAGTGANGSSGEPAGTTVPAGAAIEGARHGQPAQLGIRADQKNDQRPSGEVGCGAQESVVKYAETRA